MKQFKHIAIFVGIIFSMNMALANSHLSMDSTKTNEKEVMIGHYENQNNGLPIDTNILEVGNKIFIFIEYEDGMIIDRINIKTGEKKRLLDLNENKNFEDDANVKDSTAMRGHWSGFEFGLNNFYQGDLSFEPLDDQAYFDLNAWRSWNFNFNFGQSTTPIIKERLALVGGFGISMNQFNFRYYNSLDLNPVTHYIDAQTFPLLDDLIKSKLNITYITMPALLELQPGKGKSADKLYISAGVTGGLRIRSKQKVVYVENDTRSKIVEKNEDLKLNRWKLDATARLGYKDVFNIYASYAITPLFEKKVNPDIYPLSFGLRVNFGN